MSKAKRLIVRGEVVSANTETTEEEGKRLLLLFKMLGECEWQHLKVGLYVVCPKDGEKQRTARQLFVQFLKAAGLETGERDPRKMVGACCDLKIHVDQQRGPTVEKFLSVFCPMTTEVCE